MKCSERMAQLVGDLEATGRVFWRNDEYSAAREALLAAIAELEAEVKRLRLPPTFEEINAAYRAMREGLDKAAKETG